MHDPYETLGVARGCPPDAIRKRYLSLVREFPPERAPLRFAEIRAAYEQLRDPVERIRRELFRICTDDSLEGIIAEVRERVRTARIPLETLLALAE